MVRNVCCCLTLLLATEALGKTVDQPNILCITCEDISPRLGCYGDPVAKTPNLDEFSKEAIRYTRMFTTVGVSAPSRSALITGMYPTAIGSNYMRNFTKPTSMPEGIPPYQVVLPEGIKCYTEYMRAVGYYCTNNAKTDYQFDPPLTAWDEQGNKAHWKNAPKGKPFFSIFNLNVTHESQVWVRSNKPLVVSPEDVQIPPYYPDDPVIRHDMAVMYSNIYEMDRQFKVLVDELKAAGKWDNTIIIWFSDNGGPLPREKRAVYETGMLVPFMIRFPDGYKAGTVEDRMCMFPDIPATILSLAGIRPPEYMQGEAFLGKFAHSTPRLYVYGARNRMDEQIDKQGAVRDKRFRYIRNYNPERPNYNSNAYRLQMPMMRRMIELLQRDSLGAEQMRWFAAPRGKEEFYDVEKDPYEMRNLIADPSYEEDIARLRKELDRWINKETPRWLQSEIENQEMMWPGAKQPELREPVCVSTRKGIILGSLDKSVSYAYQINGKGYTAEHWFLYTEPILLKKGDILTVIAVRAGMKNSKKVEFIK